MKPKKYRHIVWDWNGTLLDDAWLCADVMNGMLSQRNLPPITLSRYREIFDFPVKDYYRKLGFDFDKEPFETVGMDFMILYNRRQKECRLHAGAMQALEKIRSKGYLQSILSARQENELRKEVVSLDVSRYFENVLGLDDHYAHGKTDVGIRLLGAIAIPLSRLLFIGDTRHDAEVAKELGIDCILIPNGHQSEERIKGCGYPLAFSYEQLLKIL
jgi:phosphoglycolate phosphatase